MGKNKQPHYAMEGSIAVAGLALNWLKNNLNLISDFQECEKLASSVTTTGGVYFVPAFSGLYAPYWRMDARGYFWSTQIRHSSYSTNLFVYFLNHVESFADWPSLLPGPIWLVLLWNLCATKPRTLLKWWLATLVLTWRRCVSMVGWRKTIFWSSSRQTFSAFRLVLSLTNR